MNALTENIDNESESSLRDEVLELRARIAELENQIQQNDLSTLVDMLMGTVNQMKADMQNNLFNDMGPDDVDMDEIGGPGSSLPTADYQYQVYQRKSDDSYAFDWVRAHS